MGWNSIKYANLSPSPKPAASRKGLRVRGVPTRDLRYSGPNSKRKWDRSSSTDGRALSFLQQPVAASSTPRELSCSPATPLNQLFAQHPLHKRFALACCEPFRPSMSLPCFRHFGRRIRISWSSCLRGPREELEKRLEQKKLDVCLTSLSDTATNKTSVALFTEPYVLAVNQNHRFAKLRSITLDDLQGEPFILRTSCETFQDTTALLIARGNPHSRGLSHRSGRSCARSGGCGNRRGADTCAL